MASLENRSDSGVAADLAEALRGELELALLVVDEAGLLELLGQLRELLEAAGGVVAEEVAGPVDVDLGQGAGRRRAAQHLLELVEVAELVEHLGRLGEPERVLAGEVVAPLPAHLREQLLEVAAELVHLPAQVHVLEQRLGQPLQLRPLLGRHRVHHRLHGRHALGHDLEQLVEGGGVLREEVAVALHELLEGRLGVLAGLLHGEQVVEVVEHVLHALHGLGAHLLHGPGHLVEVALRHLLAELVHQLVELLAASLEVNSYCWSSCTIPARSGGSMSSCRLRSSTTWSVISWRRGVAALPRLLGELVEALPLHVEHLAERLGDLLVDAAEVVALELVAPAAAQALHQVAHAHHLVAVPVAEALLHHPAQGGVEVAVVQQVVGDLLEHRVGVEVEPHLGAVPLGVPEPRRARHRRHRTDCREGSDGRRALEGSMHVDIWSDVACPWCYVGTQRFGRAVQETGRRRRRRVPVLRARPHASRSATARRSSTTSSGSSATAAACRPPTPGSPPPAPSSASTSGGRACGAPTRSTPTACWPGRSTSTAPTSSVR